MKTLSALSKDRLAYWDISQCRRSEFIGHRINLNPSSLPLLVWDHSHQFTSTLDLTFMVYSKLNTCLPIWCKHLSSAIPLLFRLQPYRLADTATTLHLLLIYSWFVSIFNFLGGSSLRTPRTLKIAFENHLPSSLLNHKSSGVLFKITFWMSGQCLAWMKNSTQFLLLFGYSPFMDSHLQTML